MNAIDIIKQTKIIPVITIENPDLAQPLGNALLQGRIPVAEITFRTREAAAAISQMHKIPGLLTGAGTVLTREQVDAACAAGAKFIVAPGFNPRIADHCQKKNVLYIPGINSPTQIELAMEKGLNILKFFPAQASGGIPFLKAISAPYRDIKFIPTGGININNINDYLSLKSVIACGGTWIVQKDLIADQKFSEIEGLCREAVNKISDVNK